VETLRGAGLKAGEIRVWLLNLNRGYPIWTPRWAWQQPAVNALDDGYEDLVWTPRGASPLRRPTSVSWRELSGATSSPRIG
jgi:hypothetical protein